MANSSPPDYEKGSYKTITVHGRKLLQNTHTESNPQKSFWSVLAKKAKHVLLEDDSTCQSEAGQSQYTLARLPAESKQQKGESPMLQKRLVALTSSLSSLGGTIGNAIEESLNKMEAKASDLMSSKRGTAAKTHPQDQVTNSRHEHCCPSAKSQTKENSVLRPLQQQHPYSSAADKETQLKASRDVAMAMAAKAKLLLRELKDAKADLAAARECCAQLEEENRMIRASINNGLKLDEEDLVRIQLETLLAEKARLAQENAYFARENQFLREMIEYHRLTMQSGGTLLEEGALLEPTEKSSDCNFEEDDELPLETIISTVSN